METHVQRQQERDQKKVIGPGFTCSKSTIETLEKGVKYFQS